MKRKITLIFLSIIAISAIAAKGESPSLKSIMRGLSTSMNSLNQGIFYEDFHLIEKAALELANHPKPVNQLPIVMKTLKERMPGFKKFDGKVHNSALNIASLAKKKDLDGILKQHRVIMNNCVACHAKFRAEIVKALSK